MRMARCRPRRSGPALTARQDKRWIAREETVEKTFGFIMLAVLIVVAILGFHYSH
jgi:hypothetical protein